MGLIKRSNWRHADRLLIERNRIFQYELPITVEEGDTYDLCCLSLEDLIADDYEIIT